MINEMENWKECLEETTADHMMISLNLRSSEFFLLLFESYRYTKIIRAPKRKAARLLLHFCLFGDGIDFPKPDKENAFSV